MLAESTQELRRHIHTQKGNIKINLEIIAGIAQSV